MAGEAKTTNFMLGTATLMIGPQASVWNLTPPTNSVGLIKNLSVMTDVAYTDLSQGVRGNMIYSMMTQNSTKITAEVYEFTSQNLRYALSEDGTATVSQTAVLNVITQANAGTAVLDVNNQGLTNFLVGDWVLVQNGVDDQVYPGRIIARNNTVPRSVTVNFNFPVDIPAGSTITKVNNITVGDKDEVPFLSAAVFGELADSTKVRLFFPKVRVTKGFSMAFTTDQFSSLPFEITLYDLLSSENFYADFAGKQALMFTAN